MNIYDINRKIHLRYISIMISGRYRNPTEGPGRKTRPPLPGGKSARVRRQRTQASALTERHPTSAFQREGWKFWTRAQRCAICQCHACHKQWKAYYGLK